MVRFIRQKDVFCINLRFKRVEVAEEVSNAHCSRVGKDVTMEYPFLIQTAGTACHVPDRKQGKMAFF